MALLYAESFDDGIAVLNGPTPDSAYGFNGKGVLALFFPKIELMSSTAKFITFNENINFRFYRFNRYKIIK